MPEPTNTPDLITLALLVSVAEAGSVSRAAQANGLSQPSASLRLSRLERRAGVALLVRTARGTALTPAGEAVAAWARPVLDAARALSDGLAALHTARAARLRIAASLTVAEYLMPGWLLALRRRHPDIDTAVRVGNSQAVADLVRGGEVDVGFVETPDPPAGLVSTEVGRDRLTFVVAASYPLARRGSIRPADLADQPVLLREPGSGTRDTLLAALGRAELRHATELGSTATIIATALAGGGIGVVSARAVEQHVAAGTLVEIRLAGKALVRPLRAVWIGRWPAPLARELVTLARASAG